jgi:DNA transposition AAA+ family ATPase
MNIAAQNTRTGAPQGTGDTLALDLVAGDPDIYRWLESHLRDSDLTHKGVGKLLGYPDGTYVNRYLRGLFEGDLAAFERRVSDYRDRVAAALIHQRADAGEFFPTSVSRQITLFLNTVRAAMDIGIVHGPSGIGKTRALEYYAEKNSNTVLITLDAAHRTGRGIQQLLWPVVSKRGYKPNTPRWQHLYERYAGSGTLFLVDNAQRLVADGRDWLCDWYDKTGCPIGLAGNPSIISSFALVEQHHSRTFQVKRPTLKNIPDLAGKLVAQYLPDAVPQLAEMAAQVAAKPGHLRTVAKCLKATIAFLEFDAYKGDPAAAFAAARANSIHA